MVFEFGNTDAIDAGSTFVLDHPLVRKLQVTAFAHGTHQPARLRFRPPVARRLRLGTQGDLLRIPSGFLRLRPVLPTGFCLLRLHRETTAYSRSLMFGPSAYPSTYYGLC